jgi:hypothetical protein
MSEATRATLTNSEVLAVDQDSLGLQGTKTASSNNGLEVWSKALSAPGSRAVLLLNRTGDAASITAHWSDLGLEDGAATVRDLWTHKDLGSFSSSFAATVASNDALLIVVRGSEGKLVSYAPSRGENLQKETSFAHVASHAPMARVQIIYTNPDQTSRYAEMRVNGRTAIRVALPPTGGGKTPGAIWIQVLLDHAGSTNVLEFSPVCDQALAIESIAVE